MSKKEYDKEHARLVREIKKRIPKGKKVYLDGNLQTDDYYYLWWYVQKEGGILWIEFECEGKNYNSYGRIMQQAADFDLEELGSILNSMTTRTIPDYVPCGVTVI